MLVTLCLFCFIATLILHYYSKLRLYREAAQFPGPPAIPVLGNAHFFVGDTTRILERMMEMLESYPSPFRVWLGSRLFITVYDPESLKIILLSPKTIEKEDLYKYARPWLGTGLFTAPAGKWRVHRKLISPTFNSRTLASFVEIFAKQSEIMATQMRRELNGGEFDVFKYLTLCTLDIVCETAMGVVMNAQTQKANRYVDSAKRMFEIIHKRIFKIWLHPDFIFNFTQLGRDQRECLKYLHGVTNDVIREKRHSHAGIDSSPENENSHERTARKKNFLQVLMELSKDGTKFTEEELREEVDSMMIAGNDTTATINTFAILMLATHPLVQEKAYQELCDIYGDEVSTLRPILIDELNRMVYLERVIRESLRIFPVAPIIVRQVDEDLEIGKYTLPKGSSVVVPILKVHRCEEHWPNPLKFDPDRFLPEEVAKRHPYSYIPFSAGPRNCLGLRYAMMVMKVLLATLLRRYVLKKDQILDIRDIKLKAELVIKPTVPIAIRIEDRKRYGLSRAPSPATIPPSFESTGFVRKT